MLLASIVLYLFLLLTMSSEIFENLGLRNVFTRPKLVALATMASLLTVSCSPTPQAHSSNDDNSVKNVIERLNTSFQANPDPLGTPTSATKKVLTITSN